MNIDRTEQVDLRPFSLRKLCLLAQQQSLEPEREMGRAQNPISLSSPDKNINATPPASLQPAPLYRNTCMHPYTKVHGYF